MKYILVLRIVSSLQIHELKEGEIKLIKKKFTSCSVYSHPSFFSVWNCKTFSMKWPTFVTKTWFNTVVQCLNQQNRFNFSNFETERIAHNPNSNIKTFFAFLVSELIWYSDTRRMNKVQVYSVLIAVFLIHSCQGFIGKCFLQKYLIYFNLISKLRVERVKFSIWTKDCNFTSLI